MTPRRDPVPPAGPDTGPLCLAWQGYRLDLAARTHIMGVLNVTPDSFSDGGRFIAPEAAAAQARGLAAAGADIIDVGGESTRPFSARVSAQEEMDRVLPVIERLAREIALPISIDTYKASVAREALKAGAALINDITALRYDPGMASLAAATGVPLILMHMRGMPEDMQVNPAYDDLWGEVTRFFTDVLTQARRAGVAERQLILDPGIGFGKTAGHNLTLLRHLERLAPFGRPILVGPSRKGFIGQILNRPAAERDIGTLAAVAAAVTRGAHIVRVHNVRLTVDLTRVLDAILRA